MDRFVMQDLFRNTACDEVGVSAHIRLVKDPRREKKARGRGWCQGVDLFCGRIHRDRDSEKIM